MKYIYKNIKNQIVHEKMILLIMCLCVFITSIVLYFAYGLYQNSYREKADTYEELHKIKIDINPDVPVPKEKMVEYLNALSEETLNAVSLWFIAGTLDDFQNTKYPWLDSRFIYRNGEFHIPQDFRDTKTSMLRSGRMITDEEEEAGDYVAVVAGNVDGSGWNAPTERIRVGENEIMLFGQTYTVVGVSERGGFSPIVPFRTIPDDFQYNDVMTLLFDDAVTRRAYNDLKNNADKIMPGSLSFPKLNLPDEDAISIYNNIIWISLLISVLSILNFAMLYHFVLQSRGRDLAILRICGCTKWCTFCTYLSECLIVTIPLFLAGTAAFRWLLNKVFDDIFPYMSESYSEKVYIIIFVGYLLLTVILLSIMILRYLKQSILQGWKEGKQ